MKNKKILGVGALLLLAAAMLFAYISFRETPQTGSKQVTVEVVDDSGAATVYEFSTDALYLRQVMEQAEGLTFEGADGMVTTVNGLRADYVLDGAYWGFFVNGEYCNYGIDQQPVEDADRFSIVYTLA